MIREGLPVDLANQIVHGEFVHYFSYISYKGGCFSTSSRQDYWIALTNKRVLYKARVIENARSVEKEGVLPLDKISFIEVTDVKDSSGCSSSSFYEIRISTSGGTVSIPVPTKEKGYEIRNTFLSIMEQYNQNQIYYQNQGYNQNQGWQ